MSVPKRGDTLYCVVCNRARVIQGVQTGWERATLSCSDCSWTSQALKRTRAKCFTVAHLHADAWQHNVVIHHDGLTSKVKPKKSDQLYLIDPLILAETDTKP